MKYDLITVLSLLKKTWLKKYSITNESDYLTAKKSVNSVEIPPVFKT